MRFPPAANNPLATRADLERLLTDLLTPLAPRFTPHHAGLELGEPIAWYGAEVGRFEAFARPLWGILPHLLGGGKCPFFSRWIEGFHHGSNPTNSEFWGWAGDCDQRLVETPIIALTVALLDAKQLPWSDPAARARMIAWLSRINQVRVVDNNWRFFRVLTNVALRRLGADYSVPHLNEDLARLDAFYLGEGWYRDGEGRHGDYYVPMAMHFYGLIYATLAQDHDPARAERYRARAARFAQDFVHWFAADGAAIPFGRSLTYRFAQGAFWGALAFADLEALPWGQIKGLYLRHLRQWMQQPIFTDTGLLTVGYAYPQPAMGENYNAAGSPYWAFKAFFPLAVPADHPFWTAEELPLTIDASHSLTIPAAGLVITRTPNSDHVVALNAGQPVTDYPRHAAAKYSKFAYSSRFAFCVPHGSMRLADGGFDSTLALSDDKTFFRSRETALDPTVAEGVAHSQWAPWPDVEVHTWLIAAGAFHLRVHRLKTARPLWSAEGGFAIGFAQRDQVAVRLSDQQIIVSTPLGHCGLRDLLGVRHGEYVFLEPHTNLQSPLVALPFLRHHHPAGCHWLACVVSSGSPDAPTSTDFASEFRATLAGLHLRLSHRDQLLWSSDAHASEPPLS
jgi:hypothetical protein